MKPAYLKNYSSLLLFAMTAVWLNFNQSVRAANRTWSGGASPNFNWNVSGNWDTLPVSGSDALIFGGSTGLLNTNDYSGATFTGITYNIGSGTFTSYGNSLTLGGNVVNNSTSLQTLNFPIASTAVRTFTTTAGGGDITLGGAFTGTGGGITKAGSGTLTLSGVNSFTGGFVASAGRVNITANTTASGSLTGGGFNNIGNTANTTAIVATSSGATLTWNTQYGGDFADGGANSLQSAALYNAGTFNIAATAANAAGTYLPNSGNSYGYFYNTGSATISGRLWMGNGNGNAGSVGMLDIPGGTVTVSGTGQNNPLYVNHNGVVASSGINITGGTLAISANGVQELINNKAGSYSSINITGAGKMTLVGGSGFCMNDVSGATSTFTLASGGELDAAYTYTYNSGTTFNFNNGTLKATAANGLFEGGGPYAVYVYSGGATINNNGFASSVQFPLLAPVANGTSTYGVTGITLSGTTNGYIGAPLVKITGGGGQGASAIANFDPSSGIITSITVTAPGSGYTSTPTVTLAGGNGGSTGSGTGTAIATASIGAVSSGGVTFSGSGTTTLSGASTYTGNTVVSAGKLSMASGSSMASGNIVVSNNATFDVSGISFTLGGSQSLLGYGTNNGAVNTTSGSKIYAGTDGGYGTNTFNGNLTLVSGATCYFDLTTNYNGSNDFINVTGSLSDNGSVQISAPSTSVNLDTNQDYVLITAAGGISGTISPTPLWGVKPLNWRNFTVVTNGSNIQLHYTASTPPVAAGSASPAALTRNQSTLVSVTVTPGTGTVDPSTGVSLDESSLGLSSVYLVLSGTPNVYTNTVTIPATLAAGNYTLNALVTDSTPLTGSANVALTVVVTNRVWNGAGANNLSDNDTNWAGGSAPGYVGDAVTFAGNVNTSPDLDQNYTVTGVTFNTNAGSFTISTAESTTLTLTNGSGIVNNSTNAQTLNVPITLGASQAINAAGGDINVAGGVSGNGSLTKTGNNALTVSANSTLGGIVNVNNGTLAITNGTTTLNNGSNPNFFIGTSNATATVLVADGATLNSTTANTFLRLGVDAAGNAGVGIINIADASSTVNIGGYGMGFGQNGANGKGTVYNSGTFNSTAGGVYMGNNDNAYAYFLNSGTVAASGNFFIAHNDATTVNGANAVLDVTGGTVTVSSGANFKLNDQNRAYSGTSGGAQANITGGTLSLGTYGTTIQLNQGGNNYSAMNITGTGLVASTGSSGFELAVNSSTNTATTLTLQNGGTLQAAFINKAGTASSGVLTFNNGTLVATAADATALIRSNVTTYIQSGGATIDDNGNSPTVAAALLAPAGNGVTSITLGGTTNGYIGAPVVKITGGGGQGAAAIATFDKTLGAITGIVVTSPGSGYTSAPTVTLAGGNGSATATAAIGSVTSGGLTKIGSGTLTLSGANTYTGNTTISNGTLAVSGGGSISSASIIVTSGATFDSSASSFALGSGQNVQGDGAVNGLTAGSGSKIFPGTDGTAGTLSFNGGGLALSSGATVNFDLSTTYNGANDQITGSGTLTLNGNSIHIKAPSTSASLDNTADYVLITAGSISGSFSSTPVWDVKPLNWANYTVVTSGSQVTLHYSTLTPPTGIGMASPSTAVHDQNVLISVTVTNGSGTVDPATGVVLNASTIGGPSSVYLVLSGTPNVYTNTIAVPPSPAAGSYTLTAQITDSNGQIGTANIALAVTTTEVWNGGGSDANWDTGSNWVSTVSPDLTGNSLIFAGSAGTSPNMDNSYSVTGLTFSNNAASFTIGTTTSSTLTLTGGITNDSANAQTLNVPIADAGGGLTKSGNGTVILTAINTYTGNTTINAGVLNVGDAGQLNAGAYAGAIADNGTFAYSSSASQLLSGVINGAGGLMVNATNGGVLVLGNGGVSTISYTGPTVVNGGELQLHFTNNPVSYGIYASSGLTINNGGTVSVMNDNSLCGYNTTVGSLPVTINAGGLLTSSATAGSGAGTASHVRGLLTLKGGTFASGGTGQSYWGTWNLDDGVAVSGGTNTSTISALDVTLSQGGGTVFAVTNGSTASGIDLDVTGTIVHAGGAGDTGLILTGNGTVALESTNTYTSATTIGSGCTLVIGTNGQLGGGTYSAAITNNGVLDSKTTVGQTLSGVISGTGSLVVNSVGGTLILSGANTYSGNTTISAGTLELAQSAATLATNSTVTIASGAQLKLDAATVTNQAAGLVTNGVPAGNGLYSSANSSGFIVGSGYLQVGAMIVGPTGPASITNSINGSMLSLSWPAGQGWRLQMQTNGLATGLGTNWIYVTDGSVSSTNITVDPDLPTAFYRLRYP